ncbi:hypothetical protein ACWZHB_23440 [Nocardia sp. FBN12]|uniref:hypothetical protein n=1 Tax=Nocardia sp. FBN12 TaxID=3419766 RepID=UPI003CFC8FE1
MKRTIAAVAFTAAVLAPAHFATATTASAALSVATPIDGPVLGSTDEGCNAAGCSSPLAELLLITLPELLSGSGS